MGLQTCGVTPTYLNRFADFGHIEGVRPMPRVWLVIVIVAACAMVTGFLLFGGANMGQ